MRISSKLKMLNYIVKKKTIFKIYSGGKFHGGNA